MPGVLVIIVGVLVLLRALNVLPHTPFWITISILAILAGLKMICCGGCKCCDKA
jgi:hypothetical protein